MTWSTLGRSDTGQEGRRQQRAERLASLTFDEMLDRKVAFGSAEELIGRFQQLEEELGIDGVVAELNAGGLIPQEQVTQSLRRLTQDVMPALK